MWPAGSGEIGKHRGDLAAEKEIPHLPLLLRGELLEEAHFARGEERDRHAVAIQEAVAAQGGQPRAGREDADEIERIGARERSVMPLARLAARLAQQRNRLGRGGLLAAEAGDEAPAPDLAARLEERAQPREAVGIDEAERHELTEGLLGLRGQERAPRRDLIEERGALG